MGAENSYALGSVGIKSFTKNTKNAKGAKDAKDAFDAKVRLSSRTDALLFLTRKRPKVTLLINYSPLFTPSKKPFEVTARS